MLIVCLKITPKKARNSRMMLFFELQVVVAVVGFKWHRRGKRKTQIDEIETLTNHYLA